MSDSAERDRAEGRRLALAVMTMTKGEFASAVQIIFAALQAARKEERRTAVEECNDIAGLLWVDLVNTDLADYRHAQAFDYRRAQLRSLAAPQEER